MFTVEKSQVMLLEGKATLLAEASTIGLGVGFFPDFISVVDEKNSGFLFQKERVSDEVAIYTTRDGRFQLHVLND